MLYPFASKNKCKHVDNILVNNKSLTEMVTYDYSCDHYDNFPLMDTLDFPNYLS